MMSASCESVLMENLQACMQQEMTTSPMTIGALCNVDLSMVKECATSLAYD